MDAMLLAELLDEDTITEGSEYEGGEMDSREE